MRSLPLSFSKVALLVGMCGTLAVGTYSFAAFTTEEPAPKHTIKEAMKIGHKDGLLKKILSGEATDEDKKTLLDVYVSMVESKPAKGDMESWHNLAGKAALAAAKVVVGREESLKELETATNCKACHDLHK
jgi:hypothetical protein